LLRLVELEVIDRERRMIERRIKAAKFPAVKSLDSFDFAALPSLNKALVMELARSEYVERRQNIIAVGNSGTGKTHIGLGLGLAACQKGLSVGFTTAAALVHELIEARDERRLLRTCCRSLRARQDVAHARIAKADGVLGRRGVLVLANSDQALTVHDQPAVAGWIGRLEAEDHDLGAPGKLAAQLLQGIQRDERRIAIEHEHVVEAIGQQCFRRKNRVRGTEPLALLEKLTLRRSFVDKGANGAGIGPDERRRCASPRRDRQSRAHGQALAIHRPGA
jgi:hypothetical protein